MSAAQSYEQFVNDDPGYLRWLERNPDGFVVNSHRIPSSSYLILHRTSCTTINTPARTNWTTTGYIKTCATDEAPLAEWARRATGGGLTRCGVCRPAVRSGGSAPPSPTRGEISPAGAVRTAHAPSGAATSEGRRSIPPAIQTGCPELDRAWASYAAMILDRSQILIPDTEDDLNWHAFLGHSIDMQGFRAAEFAGVDPLTRHAPGFVPLKRRGLGIPELAALWEIKPLKQHLLGRLEDLPLEATLRLLRAEGGAEGSSLAEAFEHFPWRKFHWSVRALIQNAAALRPSGFSFRRWLGTECEQLGAGTFPPADFRQEVRLAGARTTLEQALRDRLRQTFYMVGPAMSAYMLCDWQLWLWREGRTAVFANYKLDSFHEAFAKTFGRGVIPHDEAGFARWWLGLYPTLPPRLANESIWLAVENKLVNPW